MKLIYPTGIHTVLSNKIRNPMYRTLVLEVDDDTRNKVVTYTQELGNRRAVRRGVSTQIEYKGMI